MKKIVHICLTYFCLALTLSHIYSSDDAGKADLIIFSYNRPLQLFALLESIEKYITRLANSYVIYRTSDDRFQSAYDVVAQKFPNTIFINQDKTNLEVSFRTITLECIQSSPSAYLMFAVDDNIVTDYVNLSECIEILESSNAYAFYLRLGGNINYCYSMRTKSNVPPMEPVSKNIYKWVFKDGLGDWNYPNTVDMTLYRKTDLEILTKITFKNPNTLEGYWAMHGRSVQNRFGLCYEYSKIINIPLNIVYFSSNRNMNAFKPIELLELFERGLKIDIDPLHAIRNNSCHTEYMPQFVAQ